MADDAGHRKVNVMRDMIEAGRTPIVTFKGVEQRYALNIVSQTESGLVKGEANGLEIFFSPQDVAIVVVGTDN
jgi:hypothetical protein